MRKIRNTLWALSVAAFLGVMHHSAVAAERDEAEKSAVTVLRMLDEKNYEGLWNNLVSTWFKDKTTKDSFLANMAMGRAQLGGKSTETQLVDHTFATSDPASGYKGKIYAFNFKTAYPAGKFYERVVVIQEKDGKFRLSGIWGTPR